MMLKLLFASFYLKIRAIKYIMMNNKAFMGRNFQ